jgi:DNA-binding PadR family transcriptional regulator
MSSVRLFILDSLARHGEMHGHQLRIQAEREHVHLWTDVSVSSLYQVIKRLATEGLVTVVRSEREGNFPERQVYAITPLGRTALKELYLDGLTDIWMKPDPFDLALARLDPERVDALPDVLHDRLLALRALLEDKVHQSERADQYLTVSEKHALKHSEVRLTAEIDWLQGVIAALPDIMAEARSSPL